MGLNRRQEQQVETRRFLKRLPYCLAITRAFYGKTPTWRDDVFKNTCSVYYPRVSHAAGI